LQVSHNFADNICFSLFEALLLTRLRIKSIIRKLVDNITQQSNYQHYCF